MTDILLPDLEIPDGAADLVTRIRQRAANNEQASRAVVTKIGDQHLRATAKVASRICDGELNQARNAADAQRKAADRRRRTAEMIAKRAAEDEQWHRLALAEQRRLTSPHARLAQVYRKSTRSRVLWSEWLRSACSGRDSTCSTTWSPAAIRPIRGSD